MRDLYAKYNNDYHWIVNEEGWVKALQGVRESQLALGNGLLGSRAALEEIPYDAKPCTFFAGLYDSVGSQVDELVNLPNAFNFKITTGGEKLGVATMDVLEHKRELNMKHGLLSRHTVFRNSKGNRFDYQSMRFLSMHTKNIGVMQIAFTPIDKACTISIQTGIDTGVYNAGTVTEGRKKHFRVKELGQFKNEGYLIAETFTKAHTVIVRSGFYYKLGKKKAYARDNVFQLKLKKGQKVVFTKIVYIDATWPGDDLERAKKSSEKKFRKAFSANFNTLLKRHIKEWEKIWDAAAVSIWGEPEIEKNFRFNIYHMIICAPCNGGRSSIGAKALTGEGYRGHIFWDTEIYMLPFYLFTMPEAGKDILSYRYLRLDAARENAKKQGYKGAMFPWESAGSGKEQTPKWAKDLDGKVIKIHTGQREHHITANIAHAFYYYYNATHEEAFLKKYGYEVIFEAARFWASRVEYSKKKKIYEIKNVIGPDEFHEDVNNNAYTNMMAKWNLLTAARLFYSLKNADKRSYKTITKKIGLQENEARQWSKIAPRIRINVNRRRAIEQFDGYFRKRYIQIRDFDENYLPIVPKGLTPRDYAKTQFIKQADVVTLLNLLPDVFSAGTKKANYKYYLGRTLHKSSLSLPAYALLACTVSDIGRAYQFFRTALHTDMSNINRNTGDGIHAACIGGTWQVLINGFVGLKIHKEVLSVNPRLPSAWRKVLFSLKYRGGLFRFEVTNDKVRVSVISTGKRRKFKIRVFRAMREVSGGRVFTFTAKGRQLKRQNHYL